MTSTRYRRRRFLLLFLIVVFAFVAFNYVSTSSYIPNIWSNSIKERFIAASRDSTKMLPIESKSYSLLAAIYSLPEDEPMRNAVRDTWGQYLNGLSKSRLLFFVGNAKDNNKLVQEEKTFNDIVRLDLIDSFKNQSLRSIYVLKWLSDNNVKVQYLLRVHVRVFVNIPKLAALLKGITAKTYMLGQVTEYNKPERSKDSPWYLSLEEYPEATFPQYLQSYGYVMTGNLIEPLLKADRSRKRIWIEDVYVTGILAKQLGVQLVNSKRFTYSQPENKCDYPKIIVCLCPSTYDGMKGVYAKVEMPDEECEA